MVRGRCLCGDVTFAITGEMGMVMHCHCSMCRRSHGTGFATHGAVPADGFRWLSGRDAVRRFAASPGVPRPFCRRCGSKVPAHPSAGLVFVPLGNLTGDPRARPMAHIFVASKAPWEEIAGDLPRFDAYPPGVDAAVLPDPVREPAPAGVVRGGCLCGGVAYEISGAIEVIRHCHCSRCRLARGAAHATNGFVDPARLRYRRGEDRLDAFKVPDAERFTQTFCRDCGSPMPRVVANRPYVVIPMGSVEGDPGGRPREHIFVGSMAPWYEIADALPRQAEYAPA